MVKAKNANVSPEARKANAEAGLKPGNPEPLTLKFEGEKRNK